MSRNKNTVDKFIREAQIVHGDMYNYSHVSYQGAHIHVEISCVLHGVFKQRPYAHISQKSGCPRCADAKQSHRMVNSLDKFKQKASAVHNNKYQYHLVEYTNSHSKVNIWCPIHGLFVQRPCDHIGKRLGCPSCVKSGHSRKAIEWLEHMVVTNKINIQHAGNYGEYRVPSTRYFADGFCHETNTIYEFYGDKWHGNLTCFHPDARCHPFDRDITAAQLHAKTVERENTLIKLGYKIVTMWEHDWDKYVITATKECTNVNI